MASPFPGMDPYLEGEMWQEFHETLAGAIRGQLLRKLPEKYVALLAKRYVIAPSNVGGQLGSGLSIVDWPTQRVIYPDVHVVAPRPPTLREPSTDYSTDVAVMEPAVELASPMPEEVPLLGVEIRDVAQRRLVTLIEILSPVNKRGTGAREYAERRIELLQTRTHILEIDLLRGGTRIELLAEPPPASYYVYLSRTERRPYTQIWPVSLRQRLPVVPVPLLSPDPDVVLDLQAAVDACFALVGYERLLDYASPPPPPPLTQPIANGLLAAWRRLACTDRPAAVREIGLNTPTVAKPGSSTRIHHSFAMPDFTYRKLLAIFGSLAVLALTVFSSAASATPSRAEAGDVPIRIATTPLNAPAEPCTDSFVATTLDHTTTVPGDTVDHFEANGAGVAIGDLDNDGDQDVVLANHAGPNTILWNEGGLRFRTERMDHGDFARG